MAQLLVNDVQTIRAKGRDMSYRPLRESTMLQLEEAANLLGVLPQELSMRLQTGRAHFLKQSVVALSLLLFQGRFQDNEEAGQKLFGKLHTILRALIPFSRSAFPVHLSHSARQTGTALQRIVSHSDTAASKRSPDCR